MNCQNIRMAFNFAEKSHSRNLQNKSHIKFKAFTVYYDADSTYVHLTACLIVSNGITFHFPRFPHILTASSIPVIICSSPRNSRSVSRVVLRAPVLFSLWENTSRSWLKVAGRDENSGCSSRRENSCKEVYSVSFAHYGSKTPFRETKHGTYSV